MSYIITESLNTADVLDRNRDNILNITMQTFALHVDVCLGN